MNEIHWPEAFLPGTTENFASNEVIVSGLDVDDVWPLLDQATLWPTYYANSADIEFHGGAGPHLASGVRFDFKTFGFPVQARVVEHVPPQEAIAGRLAWHGWAGEGDERLDVHHAWLVENLPGHRVRILTQETQKGKPAVALAMARPNPMINGHQDWLDGLVNAAREMRALSGSGNGRR